MRTLLVLLMFLFSISLTANAKKSKTLTKVMTLKLERTEGQNGASVAWDPERKKYYAAMAGNKAYPMMVYSETGKVVSNHMLETMFDVRGLWYNPTTKTLQANGFKNYGIAEYKLDEKDIPVSVEKLNITSAQPTDQNVGAYDAEHNVIWFYDHDSFVLIKEDMTGSHTTVALHPGIKKKKKIKPLPDSVRMNYNENTLVYTGTAKAGIGLLNVKERQVELYSPETGLLKKVIKLPADAPLEPSLNFSYCNGIYWFFDRKKREWKGYQ